MTRILGRMKNDEESTKLDMQVKGALDLLRLLEQASTDETSPNWIYVCDELPYHKHVPWDWVDIIEDASTWVFSARRRDLLLACARFLLKHSPQSIELRRTLERLIDLSPDILTLQLVGRYRAVTGIPLDAGFASKVKNSIHGLRKWTRWSLLLDPTLRAILKEAR